MTKKISIVTHSAGFHADDVFGVATLRLLLGEENIEVTRTRDPKLIASGDYVLDVGDVYDPLTNRFDHHQTGGAGMRENGIPYAAFGLIWKQFGAKLVGSEEVARAIDESFVQPIDSSDNGVSLYQAKHPSKIEPMLLQDAISLMNVARGEEKNPDEIFLQTVRFAETILRRKILHAEADVIAERIVREAYEKAPDKKLILVEVQPTVGRVFITKILMTYPDTLYFVRQHEAGTWQVVCVSSSEEFFTRRKDLPAAWAGKRDEELIAITGVSDAIFCHNKLFMAVAKSKEGALELAKLALEA